MEAVFHLLPDTDPILRQVAQEVARPQTKQEEDELYLVAYSLIKTMKTHNGFGLAYPQVGVSKRIIVVTGNDGLPNVMINPEIIEFAGEQCLKEGCLTFPGLYATVKRYETVRVRFKDPEWNTKEVTLTGMSAVCAQHEIDHLDGKLFIDYLSPLKKQLALKKLAKRRN